MPRGASSSAIFAVDVRAAFLLAQAAVDAFESGGVIVNLTSAHEHVPASGRRCLVQDADCAEQLARVFERDLSCSREIEPELWRDRPAAHRLKELALQPFKTGL